jgi:hypothetical protein
MYGYRYRCLVDGVSNNIFTLQFSNVWTNGAGTNAWENPGNWSCGVVPGVNDDVIINSGTVNVHSNVIIKSLIVNTGVNVVVETGYTIIVTH